MGRAREPKIFRLQTTLVGYRAIIWNTLWCHTILPGNVLTARFGKQTYSQLVTTIELQYYVNLKAYFNLNKFENLSIRLEKKSIISIQSFFSVIGWKQRNNHFKALNVSSMSKFDFFCLIHTVDFCLANVNLWVTKWFAM